MPTAYGGIVIFGSELSAINMEDAATVIKEYTVPVPLHVLDFGVYITETLTAQATDMVINVSTAVILGGTRTVLIPLTVGNSNTNLKKGDGTFPFKTAIALDADLKDGDVVLCKRTALPAPRFDPARRLHVFNGLAWSRKHPQKGV